MSDKRIWSIVILGLTIVAIVAYLALNPELWEVLQSISIAEMVPLFFLQILMLAINGLFLNTFARKFDINLRVTEWFGLSVVTSLGNYITPFSGGMFARAGYLKHRHAFPYTHFATLLASGYLINFWLVGLVGALITLVLLGNEYQSWLVLSFFLAVTVGISALLVLPIAEVPVPNRLSRRLKFALEGWHAIRADKALIVRLVLLAGANILFNGASFWWAYVILGAPIPFAFALLISLLTVFSRLISITPGNLGIQEAATSLISGLMGVGVSSGLLAALLIRSAAIVVVFALGPLFSYFLTRELADYRQRERKGVRTDSTAGNKAK